MATALLWLIFAVGIVSRVDATESKDNCVWRQSLGPGVCVDATDAAWEQMADLAEKCQKYTGSTCPDNAECVQSDYEPCVPKALGDANSLCRADTSDDCVKDPLCAWGIADRRPDTTTCYPSVMIHKCYKYGQNETTCKDQTIPVTDVVATYDYDHYHHYYNSENEMGIVSGVDDHYYHYYNSENETGIVSGAKDNCVWQQSLSHGACVDATDTAWAHMADLAEKCHNYTESTCPNNAECVQSQYEPCVPKALGDANTLCRAGTSDDCVKDPLCAWGVAEWRPDTTTCYPSVMIHKCYKHGRKICKAHTIPVAKVVAADGENETSDANGLYVSASAVACALIGMAL